MYKAVVLCGLLLLTFSYAFPGYAVENQLPVPEPVIEDVDLLAISD